jgi:hypothetical protein
MKVPSSFLPDYFRLEAMPLSETLDTALMDFSDQMMRTSFHLSPSHYSLPSQKLFLKSMGIKTDWLDSTKTLQLFNHRAQLFDANQKEATLRLLSELYFGNCQMEFKEPVSASRLNQMTSLQMGNLLPVGTSCQISYQSHPIAQVTEEFESNVSALSPTKFTFYYYLLQPKAVSAREGRRLTPWRLPCLTLAK